MGTQLETLLGEVDKDVSDMIMEQLYEHKTADEVIEELEGVSSTFLLLTE